MCNAPRPLCASRGHIRTALRRPIDLAGFRRKYEYFARGNPFCQCRVRVTPNDGPLPPAWARGGPDGRSAMPCILSPPRCCRFGGSTLREVVNDAQRKAYPLGCAPWYQQQQTRATRTTLREYF